MDFRLQRPASPVFSEDTMALLDAPGSSNLVRGQREEPPQVLGEEGQESRVPKGI